MDCFDHLLAPVDEAEVCGGSVEYDADFLVLLEVAEGRPEIQYGAVITSAQPPDWIEVRRTALALLARSRDLRLVLLLTRAVIKLHGYAGCAAALALLAGLLEVRWDSIHPQLDPADGNDPTLRVNVIAGLVDPGGVVRDLLDVPLVEARGLGCYRLRDLDAAAGTDVAAISAVFAAADGAALAATARQLQAALDCVGRIERLLVDAVGSEHAPDLSRLSDLLRRAADALRRRRPAQAAMVAMAECQLKAELPADDAAPAAAPHGAVRDRADVVRMLDLVCGYYAAQEPSSPVPLLLRRAAGLVHKDFTELLRDLAPDGLAQWGQASGRSES